MWPMSFARSFVAMLLVALALPWGVGAAQADEPASEPASEPVSEPAPEPRATTTPEPVRVDRQAVVAAEPAGILVAPPTSTGGFEVDGDTPVNNAGTDWDAVGTHTPDPVGGADTSNFGQGTSETRHPSTWSVVTGTAPGNGDLSDVHSHVATYGGETWAFFGLRRATTDGTVNYDVELNRAPNLDGPAPDRTSGDLLIRVSQHGGDAFQPVGAWVWTVAAPGGDLPAHCDPVDGYGVPSGWCSAGNLDWAFTSAAGEGGYFAEGAVNLTRLFGQDCRGAFGTVNIRSYAGASLDSSLKDWVAPHSISVPGTCGALVVEKVDQFGAPVPGAEFTIVPNPVPGAASAARLVVTDGGAGDPDGAADGIVRLDPAVPGDYRVTETGVPTGYLQPANASEDATVPQDGPDVVRFVNALPFRPLRADNVATATYDVRHDWLVRKVADSSRVEVPEGTPAEVGYTVTLKALPGEAFDHELGGTVRIDNPNAVPMVATVAVALPDGTACTIVSGDADADALGQVTIDGSATVPYTCPVSGSPTGEVATVATVTWDLATYPPLPGTDPAVPVTAPADTTYVVDEVVDEQVRVTDVFDGGTPDHLGTFSWADVRASDHPAAHTVVVDAYTREIDGVPGSCTDYGNTVTATEGDSGETTQDDATVEVCVGSDLEVDKNASLTYDRVHHWDVAKSAPATVFTDGGAAEVTYTVDLTALPYSDSGWLLGGEVLLDNPNDWPVTATLTDVVTVDSQPLPCTFPGTDADTGTDGFQVVVPADADDQPFAYTCTGVTPGDYVGTNTATVSWDATAYFTPGSRDAVTVPVDVTADPSPAYATVTLADVLEGVEVDLPQETFAWEDVWAMADHTQTLTYTRTLAAGADECASHDNTVTITGTAQAATATTEVCTPALGTTTVADFGQRRLWDLDKVAGPERVVVEEGEQGPFEYTVTATPGEPVDDGSASWTGSLEVTNPSAQTPLTVDVTTVAAVTGWTCTFDDTGSATASGVRVPAGRSTTLAYTCSGAGHPDGSTTFEVDFGGEQVTATVPVVFESRDTVGDATLEVYDDLADPTSEPELLFVADALDESTWSHTYTSSHDGVPGTCTEHTNTATAEMRADGVAGLLVDGTADLTDSATVAVCTEAAPGVETGARFTAERDHAWTIEKDADATVVELAGGGTVDVTYTVLATPGAATDSGWSLTGATTVTNPNDFTALEVELEQVTDVAEGTVCEYDDGSTVHVPARGSVSATFSCAMDAAAYLASGTTSVAASWRDPTSPPVTSVAPVGLELVAETNRAVTVVDDLAGTAGEGRELGTAEWNAEGTATAFTYTLELPAPAAGECTTYTNTATLVETSQHDDATVELCRQSVPKDRDPKDPDPKDPDPKDPKDPTPAAGSTPTDPTLPQTGAPAGSLQLGLLAMLATGSGLLLLWRSRRTGRDA